MLKRLVNVSGGVADGVGLRDQLGQTGQLLLGLTPELLWRGHQVFQLLLGHLYLLQGLLNLLVHLSRLLDQLDVVQNLRHFRRATVTGHAPRVSGGHCHGGHERDQYRLSCC